MSTIANSQVATTIYDTAGSAISSQPNNKKTRFVGGTVATDSAANITAASNPDNEPSTVKPSLFGYTYGTPLTDIGGSYSSNDVGGSNFGLVYTTSLSITLKVGDSILTNTGKVVTVASFGTDSNPNDTVFFKTEDGTNLLVAESSTYFTSSGERAWLLTNDVFKSGEDNKFIQIGVASLANSTNDAIQGAATGPNRNVNQTEALRTVMTASGIRAGNWNEYSGSWAVDPIERDDTSILGTDASIGAKKTTYNLGGSTVNTTES